MNRVDSLEGPEPLVKSFGRWVKSRKGVVMSEVECTSFVSRVLVEHFVSYLPGSPNLTIDDVEYSTTEFFETLFEHLRQVPGAVIGQVTPTHGAQDPKKTGKNGRYSQSVSYQILFRFLKANAGSYFTIEEIGEALGLFDGIDPLIHHRSFRAKKRAIRTYIRQMFRLNSSGKVKRTGQASLYGFEK